MLLSLTGCDFLYLLPCFTLTRWLGMGRAAQLLQLPDFAEGASPTFPRLGDVTTQLENLVAPIPRRGLRRGIQVLFNARVLPVCGRLCS